MAEHKETEAYLDPIWYGRTTHDVVVEDEEGKKSPPFTVSIIEEDDGFKVTIGKRPAYFKITKLSKEESQRLKEKEQQKSA